MVGSGGSDVRPERPEPLPDGLEQRHPHGGLRGILLDPARTFLVVAVVVGGAIAVLAPAFSGIDEPAHFGLN